MQISVIIPVKDDPVGLSLSLSSLPIGENIEIIVIDGGGCAQTLEVIQDRASQIQFWESGLDQGIADAMNRGISQARGKFLAILNAGDCWFPNTHTLVAQAHLENPAIDVFHGTIEYVAEDGISHRIKPDISKMAQRMWLFHPTMFVSRESYNRLGSYDTAYKLAMDCEWCHRAIAAQLQFQEIDAPLAQMALGGRSDIDYVGALREFRQSVIAHNLASPLRASFWYAYVRLGKAVLAAFSKLGLRKGAITEILARR